MFRMKLEVGATGKEIADAPFNVSFKSVSRNKWERIQPSEIHYSADKVLRFVQHHALREIFLSMVCLWHTQASLLYTVHCDHHEATNFFHITLIGRW